MRGAPLFAAILLGITATAYAAGLALVRRYDRAYPSTDPTESTWWFGYLKDLTNLGAFLGFGGGYVVAGYPPPLAMLASFLTTLVAYGLDYLLARALTVPRTAVTLAILLLVSLSPLVVQRARVAGALQGMVAELFDSPKVVPP